MEFIFGVLEVVWEGPAGSWGGPGAFGGQVGGNLAPRAGLQIFGTPGLSKLGPNLRPKILLYVKKLS